MIQVYDIQSKSFRDISLTGEKNGLVCFSRDSISIIEKHYIICGDYCIDNDNLNIILIDIQENVIIVPEKFFILLCSSFIQEIEPFNICNEQLAHLSYSFFYLISSEEERDREKVEPLTLICESIIKQKHLFASFIALGISIYFPINTSELYSFSKHIHSLVEFDYISPKYERRFKYVIDALINDYHMNFSSFEIKKFAYNICQLALEKLEENYG